MNSRLNPVFSEIYHDFLFPVIHLPNDVGGIILSYYIKHFERLLDPAGRLLQSPHILVDTDTMRFDRTRYDLQTISEILDQVGDGEYMPDPNPFVSKFVDYIMRYAARDEYFLSLEEKKDESDKENARFYLLELIKASCDPEKILHRYCVNLAHELRQDILKSTTQEINLARRLYSKPIDEFEVKASTSRLDKLAMMLALAADISTMAPARCYEFKLSLPLATDLLLASGMLYNKFKLYTNAKKVFPREHYCDRMLFCIARSTFGTLFLILKMINLYTFYAGWHKDVLIYPITVVAMANTIKSTEVIDASFRALKEPLNRLCSLNLNQMDRSTILSLLGKTALISSTLCTLYYPIFNGVYSSAGKVVWSLLASTQIPQVLLASDYSVEYCKKLISKSQDPKPLYKEPQSNQAKAGVVLNHTSRIFTLLLGGMLSYCVTGNPLIAILAALMELNMLSAIDALEQARHPYRLFSQPRAPLAQVQIEEVKEEKEGLAQSLLRNS